MPLRELECPLWVSIAKEHGIFASKVYQGCVLEIFGVLYPIDLIPIPMGDVCVIVGIDWLSRLGAMIYYEGHQVVVRTHSGGELVMHGEGTRIGSAFCSAARVQQYIQHVCMGYLAYVVDTRVGKQDSVLDVLVFRDFVDVFPYELLGFPPKRWVEFWIELVPGAAPIAKAPYRLALPEIQELSSHLQEFLGNQFIRSSVDHRFCSSR
ncbi:hypothetical protein Lser_V15G37270 [Lactuca serriola]